jgi:hypothetical protein
MLKSISSATPKWVLKLLLSCAIRKGWFGARDTLAFLGARDTLAFLGARDTLVFLDARDTLVFLDARDTLVFLGALDAMPNTHSLGMMFV